MLYVVDQNMMRSDRLHDLVRSEPGSGFVIPDAAFEEMVKHPLWEDTMRGSLSAFAPALDRTFCSASIGELISCELRTRMPIGLEHLFPVELTRVVREVIAAFDLGGERLEEIRRRVEARRSLILAERSNGTVQKEVLQAAVARLTRLDGPDLVSEMRTGRMGVHAQLGLLKLNGDAIVRQFLGIDQPDVGRSRISRFVTTRFVYADLWYQRRWLRIGGISDVDPKKVANDEFDRDYALVATYLDVLLSKDRKLLSCYDDLRFITQASTEIEAMDALYAHAVASGRIS